LLTSAAGDCLIIRAPNVTVNLNRQIITGQGSGAGVQVLASGANAFIEGDDATISGFSVGIQIDAATVLAEILARSTITLPGST